MKQGFFEIQARLLRRDLRSTAQKWRYRRLDLSGIPVLFANSFPKSGTHLLTQVLQGFTRLGPAVNSGLPAVVSFQGDSGRARGVDDILRDLRRLNPGDIAYGHLHVAPELVSFLCQDGFATYFIMRDPRDVVVSHVHYVTEMAPQHAHHGYYTEVLQDFDQRLEASILGRPEWSQPFPDVGERFRPYLGWLEARDVLTLRYEDFVRDRSALLGRILDFSVSRGFPLHCHRDEAIRILESAINPHNSPTFRRGKAGGWRDCFTSDHKVMFKKVAGELLIRLGYEENHDW
jgi:hypothetical protein